MMDRRNIYRVLTMCPGAFSALCWHSFIYPPAYPHHELQIHRGPLAETQMSTQGAIAAHLYTEPQLARPRPLHMQMYLNMGFNSAGTQMYRTPHILGEKLA